MGLGKADRAARVRAGLAGQRRDRPAAGISQSDLETCQTALNLLRSILRGFADNLQSGSGFERAALDFSGQLLSKIG